jgi:hypothetical protein
MYKSKVPAFGAITLKDDSKSVRDVIATMLRRPDVWQLVEPFFVNGGVRGHKVMDVAGAVDVLRNADKDKTLESFNLNDYTVGEKLKGVLRSRYDLNKAWKIAGINQKRVLYAPTVQAETNE